MQKQKPILKIRAQRPCFLYETDEAVVTVYTKQKKRMLQSEVNWWLDGAKLHLMGYETKR